jgi:drug/metabolite transporter (DMT)-like permease
LSSLVSFPFASPASVTHIEVFHLFLFGMSNMGLGLILFTLGARYIPSAQAALIGALDTPLSPIWVWLAFAEVPKATTLAGGIIVLGAVLGHILSDSTGRKEAGAA